ncbi:ATP synthase d subunit [Entomophthora muscae]|uniref:ATP synthase d subunit n=1 Tax=Entomophthora muscae TaxID=34485 RepID=A0ACC2TE84_9FUNG|nr:ATP synthase d subunit [Entomophthora muscae]
MSAVSRINWGKLASAVASRQQTHASLSAFRKQYDDLRRELSVLEGQKTTVDFEHYRNVLGNKDLVAKLEGTLKKFKPVTYDSNAQVKIIETFEAKAVTKAQEFAAQVENEVASLKDTLKNIEQARPVEELYTDDVVQAFPEIDDRVAAMVKKGQWTHPGFAEKVPPIPFF